MTGPSPSERDDIRLCLMRMSNAFVGLLGNDVSPQLEEQLRELGGIAREIGNLCDHWADRCVTVDGAVTRNESSAGAMPRPEGNRRMGSENDQVQSGFTGRA